MKRFTYVLGFIILCVVLAFAGYLAWRYFQSPAKPVGKIISPSAPIILESGDAYAVQVFGQAEAGLERIVLSVDGTVYAEESVNEQNELTFTIPWHATSLGAHMLEATVYDALGRASESASVMVGVKARNVQKTLDFVYIPAAEDAGSGGQRGVGQIVPVDNAQGNAQPNADGGEILGEPLVPDELGGQGFVQELDGGQVILPLTDDDVAALGGAGDGIPSIFSFEANPQRNGHQLQIGYHVEATDDLAVDRLEFHVENMLTGESSTRTMLCFNEASCTVDDVFPFASEGTWVFSVFAVDSSGQASENRVEVVEIVGGENDLLPAFVLHEPTTGFSLFEEQDAPNLWLGATQEDEVCYSLLVEPQANGNLVTLMYECEVSPSREDVHFDFEVRRQGLQDPRRFTIFSENYPGKKVVNAGESFSFLDENLVCGAEIEYSVSGLWVLDDEPRAWIDSAGSASETISTAACGADALQIADFAVNVDGAGQAALTWNILQNPNWPGGEIAFDVVRYQPPHENGDILFAEPLLNGDWVQTRSMDFTRYDADIVCGSDYFYTLNLYQGSVDLDNFLATAQAQLTDFECRDDLVDLVLDLKTGFIYDTEFVPAWQAAERPYSLSVPVIHSTVQLPTDFAWIPGDEYKFLFQVSPLDARQSSEHWTEMQIRVNEFTPRELAYNLTNIQCGGAEYAFNVYLFVDGVQKNQSQTTTIKSPPCLPTPDLLPKITGITGQACNGSANGYCIQVDYLPARALSDQPIEYFAPDTVKIFREIGVRSFAFGDVPEDLNPNQHFVWDLDLTQFNFFDASVQCNTFVSDNNQYQYKIIGGVTLENGRTLYGSYGRESATIALPNCGDDYALEGSVH